MIDQLSALAKNPGDVYISLVPFAENVNANAASKDRLRTYPIAAIRGEVESAR